MIEKTIFVIYQADQKQGAKAYKCAVKLLIFLFY
jgi:hypothetical protein